MSLSFFSDIGDVQIWTLAELKAALKATEQAFLRDVKQVQFYGQSVLYNTKSDMAMTIQMLREEISRRTNNGKSGKKKKILMTTRSKGF